jgi:hypothetical protein
MPGFQYPNFVTDEFLYKELSTVSDDQIENYFNDLY